MLYTDYEEYFKKLTAKDAGLLLMAIFDYVKTSNKPEGLSAKADMAFAMIRSQLDRDIAKYQKKCEASKINGALGGRPKKVKKPNETLGFSEKPNETLTNTNTKTKTNTSTYTDTTTTTTTDTYTTEQGGGGGGLSESDFMDFWREYPKHHGVDEAREAYFKGVHNHGEHRELLELLLRWKNSEEWQKEEGRWIKRADKFISEIFFTRDEPPAAEFGGSFDTDDFFEAALARSYADMPGYESGDLP